MRIKAILNPCSDNGRGQQQKEIIETIGATLGDFDLVVSEKSGHAILLAEQAANDGYDVVVAAGGDGTVHEVINGLLKSSRRNCKLGVIPIGTGNDFAYAYGIPNNVEKSIRLLFEGKLLPVDLAKVVDDKGREVYIGNNLGVGFDANVVIRTREIKKIHGFLKYFLGVLKTLVLDFYPIQLKMRFDDQEVAENLLFIAFGLGPRHGGGFMLTPDAQNNDGLIDTCMVRNMNRLKALIFLKSGIDGTHITNPLVTMRQSKLIEISSEQPLPIHADGEVFAPPADQVHHLTIVSLPAVLEVIA